ncbi:MAG: MFS transporter [Methylococcaceae bacterium]|nr:MAG: MFS transporter [Methylococcaceae bacterium]
MLWISPWGSSSRGRFRRRRVVCNGMGLALLYFLLVMGLYGIAFWMPQIVHDLDRGSYAATGLLTAIPYGVAALGMVRVGMHSDRQGERRRHLLACTLLGAAGFAATWLFSASLAGSLAALSCAALGVLSALALFWALPTAMLSRRAAAGGIALINSVGNLGGYVSPASLGGLKEATGQMASGLLLLAGTLGLAALLGLRLTHGLVAKHGR